MLYKNFSVDKEVGSKLEVEKLKERRKKIYLLKIKREIKSSNLIPPLYKQKIKPMKDNE